jgi:4-hydroxybenzoate polyprenyltransferase
MIKILGIILTVGGAIALVMGILGIFGSIALMLSPWALSIIGFIFFISGISLIKRRKDTEDIEAEKKA